MRDAPELTGLAALAAVMLIPAAPGVAQEAGSCAILCMPELKIEPTVTFDNLADRPRVETGGIVEQTKRETVFELIFALEVPTEIPRVGLTFEAAIAPFASTSENPFTGATAADLGRDDIRDNVVEIESELNLDLVESDQTGGWLSSHFDIIDQFSPGERPNAASVYTHKLDIELDTALHVFNWLPEGHWLRNLELELSIDYLATGLPETGDMVGDELFLDDASPWSLSLVVVLPLAPLDP